MGDLDHRPPLSLPPTKRRPCWNRARPSSSACSALQSGSDRLTRVRNIIKGPTEKMTSESAWLLKFPITKFFLHSRTDQKISKILRSRGSAAWTSRTASYPVGTFICSRSHRNRQNSTRATGCAPFPVVGVSPAKTGPPTRCGEPSSKMTSAAHSRSEKPRQASTQKFPQKVLKSGS